MSALLIVHSAPREAGRGGGEGGRPSVSLAICLGCGTVDFGRHGKANGQPSSGVCRFHVCVDFFSY